MEVFVDDKQVEDKFVKSGTTVQDAVRHVQSFLCTSDQMVIGLRCDGQEVPADAMAETLQKPAESLDRLDVFTGTKDELVTDAMAQASASLAETEDACKQVAELLCQGKTVEASETLAECLRIWRQVHEAVANSIQILQVDPENTRVCNESLLELIGKPKEVLLQVRGALQARDYVLLADILQYEFCEVTEQWHTIIGKLRQEAEDLRTSRSPGGPG